MTLSEFVKTVDVDMIKLGAVNGSGFFFIGPVEELRGDGMQRYEYYIREYEFNRIGKTEETIQRIKKRKPEDEEHEKEKERLIKKYEKRIKIWTEYYKNRKPFGDREVLTTYFPTAYDPDVKIVIIEGDTFGKYWTLDEVKNGKLMAIANNPGTWGVTM
jgi:hypothetical protein